MASVADAVGAGAPITWDRRVLTFLAARLDSPADADPRDSAQALAVIGEKVGVFGGRVEELGPTSLLAVFGLQAPEDAPRRAAHAALAVLRAAGHASERHGARAAAPAIGLHAGDCLLARMRDGWVLDRAVRHHVSEQLHRLVERTEPGTIALTGDAVPFLARRFDIQPVGTEHRLHGPERLRFEPSGLTARRFVGRELELRQLEAALADAVAGRGRVVGIQGEPGIGKSRLLHEFRRGLAAPVRGLDAAAASYWTTSPYVPIVALVRQLLALGEGTDPATTRATVEARLREFALEDETVLRAILMLLDVLAPDAAFPSLEPQARRARTLAALQRLLLFGGEAPLVLVVEDLHWADAETVAVLEALAEGLAAVPRLLCLTYRPEFESARLKAHASQLVLRALPPRTAGELLSDMIGDDPSLTPFRPLLLERTDGNPFLLEECVRDAVERGVLVRDGATYRLGASAPALPPPKTVQAVLAGRIDRLAPGERELLQTAAVIGHRVPLRVLEPVTGRPPEVIAPHLATLRAAEFLHETRPVPDAEYTFKHWLTQEVAYASLPEPEQRAAHRRVLAALEAEIERAPEWLAYHAVRGEAWDKAVDYLREAGANAHARGALQESVERYTRALGLLPHLPPSADNLRRAIDVRLDHHGPLLPLGQIARLLELYQEAEPLARELDDARRLGLVLGRLAFCSWYSGQNGQGVRYARQALDIAANLEDAELRVLATHSLAANQVSLGEFRSAIDLCRSIVDGPEADLAKRLSVASGSPYLTGCAWLAAWLGLVGEFREARQYAERAIRAAEALDHPLGRACAYVFRGFSLAEQDQFDEARAWLRKALDLSEAHGMLHWVSISSIHLGWALAECGRPAEGVPHIERGLALQREMGTRVALPMFHTEWAAALLLDGKITEAREAADQALQLAVNSAQQGLAARALLVLGMVCAAASPPDVDAASSYYERAKALAGRLGMRPTIARCHLGLGKLYRRTAEPARAHEHLTAAAALFREMNMPSRLAQAEAELERSRGH